MADVCACAFMRELSGARRTVTCNDAMIWNALYCQHMILQDSLEILDTYEPQFPETTEH